MNRRTLLLATRNPDKLREIRQIVADADIGVEVVGLHEVGIAETPAEEDLEVGSSFEENATAKARFFADRAGMVTLADDSGLCVDALGGAPGVRSRRFSGRTDLRGSALDAANNALLLQRLAGVPAERRTARYVCAVAVVLPAGGLEVFRGTCEGVILAAPRGREGFGYDPLFYLPGEGRSFGELPPERKNRLSHRAVAVRNALPAIRRTLDLRTGLH